MSCTNQSEKLHEEAKVQLEKVLNSAENRVRILGRSSSGVDLKTKNFDSLSLKVIRVLSVSAYEARTAYLTSEECLQEKRLATGKMDKTESDENWQNQVKDSIFHSMLKNEVLRIDTMANNRSSDPTIQDLLVEIEKLKRMKEEMDKFCE